VIRVTFTNGSTGTEYDVTGRIHPGDGLIVTDEIERQAFQRVVGDVQMRLSNMDGFFDSLLLTSPASVLWRIRVSEDGGAKWAGILDRPSVVFDKKGKWVSATAFSNAKRMWEIAARTRVTLDPLDVPTTGPFAGDPEPEFLTVQDVMNSLVGRDNLSDGYTLFRYLDLTVYADRQIRGFGDSTTWGNAGRWVDLMPDTTVAELLEAMSQYYNAEFYIDPATSTLKMYPRLKPSFVSAIDLDPYLDNKTEPTFYLQDSSKVDYVRTYGPASVPPPTLVKVEELERTYSSEFQGVTPLKYHYYKVVGFIAGNARAESPALEVYLGSTVQSANGWAVTVKVPAFDAAFTERRLYRKSWSTGRWYQIDTSAGGVTEDTVRDFIANPALTNYPGWYPPQDFTVDGTFHAYNRYDEEVAAWDTPITDYGSTAVDGEVFDVVPRLRFQAPPGSGTEKPHDPYDTYSFFNRDMTYTKITQQFRDMFETKRRIVCRLKGTNWSMYQVVRSKVFPNDLTADPHMIIRKVAVDHMAKETDVELVTL
jgi:hypothetical protein